MGSLTQWKVVVHNGYDYKLINCGESVVSNVRVACPMDGVIPYGHDVEPELKPGRSVRFRLINSLRFDPNLVKILWNDAQGGPHSAMLHALDKSSVARR
jgi:hypothetical protein